MHQSQDYLVIVINKKESFSPLSIASWQMTATTALKITRCFSRSCLQTEAKQFQSFSRLLIVSWRFRQSWRWTRSCSNLEFCFGVIVFDGSPTYPSSASTFSSMSKWESMECLKMAMSFQCPQGKGPWTQTTWPVRRHKPTSHRVPGPLNLWENHPVQNGFFFGWRVSVPSTDARASLRISSIRRFSQRITLHSSNAIAYSNFHDHFRNVFSSTVPSVPPTSLARSLSVLYFQMSISARNKCACWADFNVELRAVSNRSQSMLHTVGLAPKTLLQRRLSSTELVRLRFKIVPPAVKGVETETIIFLSSCFALLLRAFSECKTELKIELKTIKRRR